MRVVHREDRTRSSTAWYQLRCPSRCEAVQVQGQDEAARLVSGHLAVCPNPGRPAQPVPAGPVIRPLVYADRVP